MHKGSLSQTTSYITLSRSALKANLKFLRDTFGEEVIISSVIKGNAYGHGICEFANLAYRCGIRHFSVFSGDEAYAIFQSMGEKAEIMVLGYLNHDQLEWCIQNRVSFFIFTLDGLKSTVKAAKKIGLQARIHIEVETGMNRTGLTLEELDTAADILNENRKHIELTGICTHFAGAESIANYYRNQKQKEKYFEAVELIQNRGLRPKLKHTSCSAAAMRFPDMRLDLVRIGIMQYGYWPSPEVLTEYLVDREAKNSPLKRVISWRTRIMNIQHVKTGEFIGYGTNYMASHPMKIAIVPTGYAHGYSRSMSNMGKVLIKGKICLVVGMVNMNSIAVDITEVDKPHPGDEVVLIGKQDRKDLSVASFSELSSQLNYELLTRLPQDIPRIIVN